MIPKQARVVVVGGGIIGSSVAYHLGLLGLKDVILLERSKLTSGTTWHAAGLIATFGSTSETSTSIRKYSRDLYSRLEHDTGFSTGFKQVGFIELAANKDRLEEYRRVAAFNRRCGINVDEICPKEIEKLFPLCETSDILAGFYVKEDGRANPVDVTMSLAAGARKYGVKIFEETSVKGITTSLACNRIPYVTGVTLSDDTHIASEYVINCTGMWARQFGEDCGVVIPNQAAEHYYLITDSIPSVDPSWPVIEDPSRYTYIRPEGDGLMIGLFETNAVAWNTKSIPTSFSFDEIGPNWERLSPYIESAMSRVPITLSTGIRKLFCGPESFTPDMRPIIGEAPECKNYFVAAGMNSIGILSGGGIGRIIAQWIINGKPDVDVTSMNINRFQKFQSNIEYRSLRCEESLSNVYQSHFPYKTSLSARGAKRSPFYDRLAANGAYFRDISGWEVPDWYQHSETESGGMALPVNLRSTMSETWDRPVWFENWKREHLACRENMVLFDMSFMSKFQIQGLDAGKYLNRLCTADIDHKDTITYTQWLNDDACIEADVTVTKCSSDKYWIVATDTMHRQVESWLTRHLNPDGRAHVFLTDVTGAYAMLSLQGPRSRELLQCLTDTDMSHDMFPYRMSKEIAIGFARVQCTRCTYVGELGYELYIPVEHALHVYERIVAAGAPLNLVHAGLKALSSLRLEKGYRDYGHDIDNTDSLLEAGLGFTADYEKEGGFIGKESLLAKRRVMAERGGLRRRLVHILLEDPQSMMYHAEPIYRHGVCVGDVRAAAYGHYLGGSVGLGMIEVPNDQADEVINSSYLEQGFWEVDIAGRRVEAKLSLTPFYDSKNYRVKY